MSHAAHIHHNGKFNWVTCLKLDGQIYVLDSISNGKLTSSLQIQLAYVYCFKYNLITVRLPKIQQQTNSIDCGLSGFANAIFCYQWSDLFVYDALISGRISYTALRSEDSLPSLGLRQRQN